MCQSSFTWQSVEGEGLVIFTHSSPVCQLWEWLILCMSWILNFKTSLGMFCSNIICCLIWIGWLHWKHGCDTMLGWFVLSLRCFMAMIRHIPNYVYMHITNMFKTNTYLLYKIFMFFVCHDIFVLLCDVSWK